MSVLHHLDNLHLLGNLFGLAAFGPRVGRATGYAPALLLAYIAGELANHAAAVMIGRPVIGASAAVFGLAGAWWVLFPHDRTARAGIALLIALQAVFASVALGFGGVAWVAHIIGAALGAALARVIRKSRSAATA